MNANWMNVNVTGYLNVMRICLALLFDMALDRYHSRQSRMNLRDVDVSDNRARTSTTEADIAAIRNGGYNCGGNKLENFKDVDILTSVGVKRPTEYGW